MRWRAAVRCSPWGEVLDVGDEGRRFTTTLDRDEGEGALLVTVVERTPDVLVVHKTHRVLFALTPGA
ncbi:hypothetical protein [Umezawaea sp. Da 62-37]|uniref:hypothetical protein n=1 Tax=Umezawaea sp. Da 62-37 TaxID=3075927 RepID=UPI0028F7400E|nr:hypothetical protein [Umezawaea sp. Da 62-37]WNV89439.1 hypothetical protein RM788_14395 [Umezawaea sp. Da 62-37]